MKKQYPSIFRLFLFLLCFGGSQYLSACSVTVTHVNVSCNGGCNGTATATGAGGTAPYTYAWNTAPIQTTATATALCAGTYTVTMTDALGCNAQAVVTITQPTVLNAFVGHTNVTCFGSATGTATATANGGVSPYTYSWSSIPSQNTSTAVNLVAGTYTCTITDANGCTHNAVLTITQPATALTLAVSHVNETCNGGANGSGTATPSGGTAPYTYSWTTTPVQTTATAGGLTAGTYTVVMNDRSGCTLTQTVTITQPSAITGSTTTTNSGCSASTGSATVTASGGTGTLTYSWNTAPSQSTATASNIPAGVYNLTVTDASGCTAVFSATVNNTGGPVVTLTASGNDRCNGGANGSATVSVSGGNPAYTYFWSPAPGGGQGTPAATGLTAGTYTIGVTDASGCIGSLVITITQPPVLTASTTHVNELCNGGNTGSATATANGGTPGYSYSWNTIPAQNTATATNLAAGTYTVTVTDGNGCITLAVATITQPAVLTASTTTTNVTCYGANNGTANTNRAGGTFPYTYSWSTVPAQTVRNITGLAPGTYTVTVTDANGCSVTATATITQPPAITATTSSTSTACAASTGTATVTASGGTGTLTYSWNSAPSQTTATATGLPAGAYSVTVTDATGCFQTFTAVVSNTGGPTIVLNSTNISCNGGNNGTASVTASGGTAPYTYSWSTAPSQTTASISGLTAGTYSVNVTDAGGCTAAGVVTITQPAAFSTTTTRVNVRCTGSSTGSATVNVTGGTGAYTYSWNTIPSQTTSTASNLPAGTYTCTITDANSCTTTAVVTINQPPVQLAANLTQTNVSCNGGNNGSVTANPTGGVGAYTYSWSTAPVQTTHTVVGLSAGTYTVTVTDGNGCTTTAAVTLTQPSSITATTTATNSACASATGSATVTASGGTGTLTYSWNSTPSQTSATATNLPAGIYQVTITDANGCTNVVSATVSNTNAPNVVITSTNVSCYGGSDGLAAATVSGGTAPYTYSWNTTPAQTTANASGLSAGTYTLTVTDAGGCVGTGTTTVAQPAALSTTMTKTNVACRGGNTGTATVSVTGGTPGYTYSWNTAPSQTTATATNLAAGSYSVTVTDSHGCSTTASVIIIQPASSLSASSVQTPVTCNGGTNGTSTVTPAGGTGPYTYTWTTVPVQNTQTATNMAAGTYTVTVTDNNGCSVIQPATITQPPAITATTTTTNSACAASTGSATVTASGGTGALTYSWSTTPSQNTTTASNLPAGIYQVTVTDANGCTNTVSATVGNINAPTVTSTTTAVSCHGGTNGTATAVVTGGTAPYTYSWQLIPAQTTATATGLSAGTYTITVTDAGGCVSNLAVTVTQPAVLASTTTGVNPTCAACTDGSVTASPSGGTGPYTYSWSTTPSQSTATASGLGSGTYTVTVTDSHGCTTTATMTITFVTGIANYVKTDSYKVYPNPATSELTVEVQTTQNAQFTISLNNLIGEQVVSEAYEANGSFKKELDVSSLPNGLYFITVETANGRLVQKVVISR